MFHPKTPFSAPSPPLLRVVEGGGRAETPMDLDAIFRRYSRYVATIGMKLLGRDDELDDLVQEVFLDAHRGLGSLREPDAIKGWLARICVRRCVHRLRRRRLHAFLNLDTLAHDAVLTAPGASPDETAEVARIYRMLERLPAEQRVVWILRHIEGASLDDLVALTKCSKSTVQRRLRAAQQEIERGVHHGRS
jgi:RNA polymerase sigma-70 factor (ECF subfamily)